ncbi:MAG: HoxN/HupN/NixA family nickel/cobalt transporter [Acidobacteria bacterium]|nr:HoxN/HupN/NixA family nickel/cobalt transporter [Acidobacteriota bacterium]
MARVSAVERSQLIRYAGVIVLLHLAGWGMVAIAAREYPFLVGLAGLAYSFGLRHAFDADHIAAIDNTTRKLMAPDARPFGVGFFFSLGHSTVVFALTLVVALTTRTVVAELPALRAVGSYVGTTVSGVFLYAMGIVNLIVLVDVYRVFRAMRAGHAGPEALDAGLMPRGIMSRWFGWLFRLVTAPRHMYWVGLLFGLGFDTATEVALLTTAGVAAAQDLPWTAVLSLPVVFAAGMSLLDSADGVMMCGAYGWALANPLRKVFYNLTITGLSVVVALCIGTIQLVSIVAGRMLGLHTGIWGTIQDLDFQAMGYLMVALFGLSWLASLAVWRFQFRD